MVDKITIGPLEIPGLKISKGALLTIWLPWPLSLKLEVPPFDMKFWDPKTLLPKITVFDPEWIHGIIEGKTEWLGDISRGTVEGMIGWITDAVFNAVEPYLDQLAEEYYEQLEKE